jgi:hypothetical protein
MLKTIKLLSIFYTMQQFQSLTYGKLTPELNFEIFGMDEN